VVATDKHDPAPLIVSGFTSTDYDLNGKWELKQGHPKWANSPICHGDSFNRAIISAFHYVSPVGETMQHEIYKESDSKWYVYWTIRLGESGERGISFENPGTILFAKRGVDWPDERVIFWTKDVAMKAARARRAKRRPGNGRGWYAIKQSGAVDSDSSEDAAQQSVIDFKVDANMFTPNEEYAPKWEEDIKCKRCTEIFSTFCFKTLGRHHCRGCGALVCSTCAPKPTKLYKNTKNSLAAEVGVRLCDPCRGVDDRRRLIDRFCRESIRCIES